jgi:hypothetical protein
MKKMTLLLVIIFTFLFSTTSWGEWKLGSIGTSPPDKYFYDKDRIRKSGKYIYLWMLIDFIKPREGGFMSITSPVQLDCSVFRFKVLEMNGWKNSMGEGEMIVDFTPPEKWDYPQPNSSVEILYNKVCEEYQ